MAAAQTRKSKAPRPQNTRWGPPDGLAAGIRIFTQGSTLEEFRPWAKLKPELLTRLAPQAFIDPVGWTFELADFHGKKDWRVFVVDSAGTRLCNVWFGGDPVHAYAYDGLVRLGDPDTVPPTVWQTYRRYSDGTYRLLRSVGALDRFKLTR